MGTAVVGAEATVLPEAAAGDSASPAVEAYKTDLLVWLLGLGLCREHLSLFPLVLFDRQGPGAMVWVAQCTKPFLV